MFLLHWILKATFFKYSVAAQFNIINDKESWAHWEQLNRNPTVLWTKSGKPVGSKETPTHYRFFFNERKNIPQTTVIDNNKTMYVINHYLSSHQKGFMSVSPVVVMHLF